MWHIFLPPGALESAATYSDNPVTNQEPPTFASLLAGYLESTGIGVTELARRLTGTKNPERAAVESRRRGLQRYLRDENVAGAPQRRKIIAALGLPEDAFDTAIPPGITKRRRDRLAEIEGLLAELAGAIGEAESPAAESIRGLLAELATKLARVQEAEAGTTRLLGELETRVGRLEGLDESDGAQATDP